MTSAEAPPSFNRTFSGPDVPGTPTEDALLFMCIYCLFIDSEVQQRPYPGLPSDL